MVIRRLAWMIVLALAVTGCNTLRQVAGLPTQHEPTALKSAETRWLLIRNPRFGDIASEPEYVWVEEDKVPTTLTTLIRGQRAIIAPPEIVAKYGSPPGGGKISPRQGVPYQASAELGPVATTAPAAAPGSGARRSSPAPAAAEPTRGYVVYVDTTRIVVDLTAADGLRAGAVISLRRNKIPVVHPVTGELLGELDDEVGTARITETREKFSVAEIQSVVPGTQIQIRDRAVPK
ncbi:MAG: hypothetical protein HY728_00205 [Candidatus Rokubacteria bacterium]|nr:hypothetical protein [Candidatus Rokubacteria bacterium]